MGGWRRQLEWERRELEAASRSRTLRAADRPGRQVIRSGRTLLNLASNDYLGLAGHPRLREAAVGAIERLGVGAGASRLVTGHLELHDQVEAQLAAFKHAEAALLLPTGYMANLAVLTTLAGPGDLVTLDKLNHASLIDAARACGATARVYPHGDLRKLQRLLERYATARRRLIVTDSVFSMEGDCADLPGLCALRDRYDAILVVDEAHGTGVLGPGGSGLAEEQGVAGRIDVTVSTASKALGCLGGIVSGERLVIDALVQRARCFIYTTAVPPPQAAAIGAAVQVVRGEPERRERLRALSQRLRRRLGEAGWAVPPDDPTPILPLVVGDEARALALSQRLERAGFLIPAIRPPTVPPGTARLRLALRCDLEEVQIERFLEALGPAAASPGAMEAQPRAAKRSRR